MREDFVRTCLLSIAVMALGLFALTEAGAGYPVAWWLYFSTSIVFGAALLQRKPWRAQLRRIGFLIAFAGLACLLYLVPWNSRKVFLRDLNQLRPGMSEAEVRAVMAGYMEGTGLPPSPFDSGRSNAPVWIVGSNSEFVSESSPSGEIRLRDNLVFRHSEEGAFNMDWGIVTLSSGLVTRVEFSPD